MPVVASSFATTRTGAACATNSSSTDCDAVRKEQKPWGIAGDAKAGTRTIEIRMSDKMRFTPDLISVREGETVRLEHRNGGKQLHELVPGTKQRLDAHAALMLKFPQMEHDEPYMAHVRAGKESEMVWTFNRAGEKSARSIGKRRSSPSNMARSGTSTCRR